MKYVQIWSITGRSQGSAARLTDGIYKGLVYEWTMSFLGTLEGQRSRDHLCRTTVLRKLGIVPALRLS